MAFIKLEYAVGVLASEAAGISISRATERDAKGHFLPNNVLESISAKEMTRRVNGLMDSVGKALKIYVKLQFETGGMALAKIASQVGFSGGSESPWAPLGERTLAARAKGYGYYGYASTGKNVFKAGKSKKVTSEYDGYGMDPAMAMEMKEEAEKLSASPAEVKPRLWTGRGVKIAMSGIRATGNSVKVRITEMTMRFNESTRPVFNISEITRLVKALAIKAFSNMRRKWDEESQRFLKEPAVDAGRAPFSLRVGEKRPFERDKVGRPKGLGLVSKLMTKKDKARLKKGEDATKVRAGIAKLKNSRSKYLRKLFDDLKNFKDGGD